MKENLKYDNQLKEQQPSFAGETAPVQESAVKTEEISKERPGKSKGWAKKFRKGFQDFLGGDYLSKQTFTGNIGFILYLAFLAMVYISNTYYTEKIYKSIDRANRELKELRYQYITTKSLLMFQGRQSEISKRAIGMGLKEPKIPPYKIQYSGESFEQAAKK